MSKRLNSAALPSLKLALTRVFWYKKELRSFLSACLQDEGIISQLDWEDYKRNIVERLIDTMVANQQRHLNQLIDLMLSLSELDDPHWLRQIEDWSYPGLVDKRMLGDCRASGPPPLVRGRG